MATSFWKLLKEYKVVIPILQRDYAQGRAIGKAPLIRENILNVLCNAMKEPNNPLELDFIYGYTKLLTNEKKEDLKVFYPLDGQQRLTTLFLLHWYIAVKEGHHEEARGLLSKFTYETRHSSRVFCSELVKFMPANFDASIKESIINQPWFFTAWNNDPTISSMLTMLDAIQHKVKSNKLEEVWQTLVSEEPAVIFHLLPMDKLGLPDELYIKMNSRGKELTDFENFKTRFSELLNDSHSWKFNHKIDQEWSDLFWDLYKEDQVLDIAKKVDAAFMRFFRFVTDILLAKENNVIEEFIDEFEIFKKVYEKDENVEFLFSILDTFVSVYKTRPDFFSSVFYINPDEYEISKTRLFFLNASVNLFKKCADCYDPKQRTNPFSIGEQLLLYSCIIHLQNCTPEFSSRIRKVRNLISNSEDTVRKENLTNLLNSVADVIINGTSDNDSKFNKTQVKEEEDKELFIMQNANIQNTVCRLEDHHLLQGCLAIFILRLDLNEYAEQFHKIFSENCDYDLISCAMLSFGDYSQKVGSFRRLGNKNNSSWRELFVPSQRRGDFNNTQSVLYKLLSELHSDSAINLKSVVISFLAHYESDPSKEKDWIYYFIKYSDFRKHEDGYYYWEDRGKQYECIMMRRKTLGGFHWSPFLFSILKAVGNTLSLDNYGNPLVYVKKNATLKVYNMNNGFKLESVDADGQILMDNAVNAGLLTSEFTCQIRQSAAGLDEEDRVEKGIQLIKSLSIL
jgi:hypothetical protein